MVYLLLPFGVGVLSSVLAGLVALGVLAWLARSLVLRPLLGGTVGRRWLATVLTLAAATLAFDAGWTHYLIPFPPTNQDDCTFGPIGAEEYQALVREMEKVRPELGCGRSGAGRGGRVWAKNGRSSSQGSQPRAVMAHIHALAGSLGAELDGGGSFEVAPSYQPYDLGAWYFYRFDLNKTFIFRRVAFRLA